MAGGSVGVPVTARVRAALVWRGRKVADALAQLREPLIPPRHLMFDGPRSRSAFRQNGEEFLGYLVDWCGLRPTGSVLDVGSGMGRKAVPLTGYLAPQGRYEGFDVTGAGVEWCTSRITRRFPNFGFKHVDVHNPHYNPDGSQRAAEFRFPYPDDEFDVVLLGSVFTHMLDDEVLHYLGEVTRVLRPSGRSLVSWFLMNAEARHLISAGRSELGFSHREGPSYIEVVEDPVSAVAYDEFYARDLYAGCGQRVLEPVHYGAWCGRSQGSFQDLVIAEAPPLTAPEKVLRATPD